MVREARERQAALGDELTGQTFRVNPRGDLVPEPSKFGVIPNDLPGPIEGFQADIPRHIDERGPSGDLSYPLDEFQLSHRIPETRYFNGPAPAYPAPGDVFLDTGYGAQRADIPKQPKLGDSDPSSK